MCVSVLGRRKGEDFQMQIAYTLYITLVSKDEGKQFISICLDANNENHLESSNKFQRFGYDRRMNVESYMKLNIDIMLILMRVQPKCQ